MSYEERKVGLSIDVDPTRANHGLDQVAQKAQSTAASVEQAGRKGAQGVNAIGDGAQQAAEKMSRSEANIIASIKRATAAAEAGGRGTAAYFEKLGQQNGYTSKAFQQTLADFKSIEQAQGRAQQSLGSMGVSAAQTAAALRGVPAQFTDIVTSLQGGQAPLTVFLQQGGQLRDMFGSAGGAAKALGGYVLGLVNPFTVTAAAVGALGYAFYKGAQEQQDFQRTLILTGNAAGVTASQLGAMASQVGAMGSGTTGRAAEVLNQIAASGKVAVSSLVKFTDAALAMERVGGQSADETAKAFADLGKAPLEASVKLSESSKYLTYQVYEQIKALQEQGKTAAAASVAQTAYADNLKSRSGEIVKNLGAIETGWINIKTATKGAFDAILDIGRSGTLDSEIEKLQGVIDKLNKKQGGQQLASSSDMIRALFGDGIGDRLAEAEKLMDRLKLSKSLADGVAAAQKRSVDAQDAAKGLSSEADKYLSKSALLTKEIAENEENRKKALAGSVGNLEAIEKINANAAAIEKGIREKYDSGVALQNIKNAEALKIEALRTSQLELDRLRASTVLNEREYITQTTQLKLREYDIAIEAAKKELAIAGARKDSEKDVADLQGKISLLEKQRANAKIEGENKVAASIEATNRETAKALYLEQELAKSEYDAMLRAQADERNRIAISLQDYNKSLDDEASRMALEISLMGSSSLERQTRLKQFEIELDLRKKLQEIDRTVYDGGEDEREQVRQRAREAAARASAQAQTRAYLDEWQKANDQLTQSLTDAITQGIMGGQGAAETLRRAIVAAFVTRPIQIAVQAMVQPVMGQLGQYLVGGQGASVGGQQMGLGQLLSGLNGNLAGSTFATGVASSLGGLMSSAGNWLTGGLGNLSTSPLAGVGGWLSSQGTALSSLSSGSSTLISGLGNGLGYFNALSQLSSGKVGGAAGAGLGTLLGGPLGSAIGGMVGGFLDKAFGGNGKDYFGADYMASSKTGGYRPGEREVGDRQWGWSVTGARSSQVEQTLKALTDTSLASLSQLQAMFGGSSEFKLGTYFSSNGENGSQGNIKLLKDGKTLASTSSGSYDKDAAAGFKQYSADVAKTVRAAMDGIGLPGWAKGMLDKLGEAPAIDDVVAAVNAISQGQQALKSLGDLMPQFAKLTNSASSTLLDSLGGIDALAQSASSYYQNFYSEAERQAKSTEQLAKQFSDLGLAVPATRDAFRALVESQDLTTESGAKTYAALLKLNPAFAALVEGAAQAGVSVTQAAEQMAEAGRRALQSLAETGQNLQVDLLRAMGRGADADALAAKNELAKITEGLSATDRAAAEAAYAANQALKAQIQAQTEANARVQQFTSTLAGLGSTRFDLENQILAQQGNASEVAKRIRDRDLAEMTKGLTAEEAARVTAAYDYNKALEAQIAAMAEAKAAAERAAVAQEQAAAEQARAAEQLRQAWQSLTDSLMGEVQRIRGLMEQDSGASYAATQAKFLITSSQARAGDQDAAKLLPSLSQTLLSLAGAQATSLAELQTIRAATASSLEQTAAVLAGKFGVTLPKLATGTNYVPATMPALLHEGEAVVPKAYNPAAGGATAHAELVAEVKALRKQVADLTEAAAATAGAAEQTKNLLVRVTENGRAMQTETAA